MAKEKFKTTIGGQALIEGVMMRGPSKIAYAVRKPDGNIEVQIHSDDDLSGKYPVLTWPIIRGAYKLIDSMLKGVDALMYSASFYDDEEDTAGAGVTVAISMLLAILMFMVLPSVVAGFFKSRLNHVGLNLLEGGLRLIIFFIYLMAISKMEDIKRVFQYHGSEHKSIACYEAREELTVANVKKYPIEHPRCGTSFLFMVMIISILVLSLFGWPNFIIRVLSRIVAMPLIAGLAYEVNRWMGKSDSWIARVVRKPGLLIQRFATVREPSDDMIEVAIASLNAVLPEAGESDTWK
ncbi:DUF1385 domain-containing protein [Peptoniphilus equinus]|uniref:DUF1385 domain-containing protein n=1 Tax=Peptoniphilus equinus TaxID=3016343 RepID=A0ABY7QVH1_9FIRM|nr:DUF1385 domain-containing protein [Peptoniphilus equinus]WBW50341.1 DUF1385 domain-containing protein [Peptoniphilus equinus]